MIADSLYCQDTIVYCTKADDEFQFSIKGAGEIFTFNQPCSDFIKDFDWEKETQLLQNGLNGPAEFENKHSKVSKTVVNFEYENAMGQKFTGSDDFEFEYTFGWNIRSNEPLCYSSDSFHYPQPTCDLYCDSEQCQLQPLTPPDRKRQLQ